MNENLRRALLRARLTDEDVAARLEVDPKTVRRWLEGRLPYLRHRWALASILDVDETDLWPQVRDIPSRPTEVQTVYPHRDDVPIDVWQDFFGCARQEIGILANTALSLAAVPQILTTLDRRAKLGVQERICLRDPEWPAADASADRARRALKSYGMLNQRNVQIRLHRVFVSNAIYRADHQLLVTQRAFGIPAYRAPVVHLQQTGHNDMATTYLESFDRIWSNAAPIAK